MARSFISRSRLFGVAHTGSSTRRLRLEVPEAETGVVVAGGMVVAAVIVVAGNIGSSKQLEHNVIGDPVVEGRMPAQSTVPEVGSKTEV